jgi:hypothetical protein
MVYTLLADGMQGLFDFVRAVQGGLCIQHHHENGVLCFHLIFMQCIDDEWNESISPFVSPFLCPLAGKRETKVALVARGLMGRACWHRYAMLRLRGGVLLADEGCRSTPRYRLGWLRHRGGASASGYGLLWNTLECYLPCCCTRAGGLVFTSRNAKRER